MSLNANKTPCERLSSNSTITERREAHANKMAWKKDIRRSHRAAAKTNNSK